MFLTGVIDAEGHHDAVLADVDPVDQQRHEIERVEGGGPPGGELRRGLRDEPALTALLLAPRVSPNYLLWHVLHIWLPVFAMRRKPPLVPLRELLCES